MSIFDLLNQWFNITDYNSDKKKYTVKFHYDNELTSYDIQKRNELIEKVSKEYKSEELICCLLKNIFDKYISTTTLTLKDYLEDDHSLFMEFYNNYKSFDIDDKIKKLSDLLSSFYKNKNLIGSVSSNDISRCTSEVIEVFDRLNVDILKTSSLPITINNLKYSDKLYLYNSLYECSIDMCNFADGIYVSYIANEEFSSDGFFTYIFKSNGNIISINDQLKEKYIGQHGVLRGRNANYTQDKSWYVFPYSIFDLDGSDSKGNPLNYTLKSVDVNISDLKLDDSLRIYICMLLLSYKYKDKMFGEISYSTKFISNGECKDLIKSDMSLSLINDYNNLVNDLKLDKNDVGSYNYGEYGNDIRFNRYSSSNTELLFKEWYNESMFEKSDCKMLSNLNEFIGTKESLKEQLLFKTRSDIKSKITQSMINYLKDKNYGCDEVLEYRNMLIKNKEHIYKYIANMINSKTCNGLIRTTTDEKIHYYDGWLKIDNDTFILNNECISKSKHCNFQDEDGECNIYIDFKPNSYIDIMELLNITDINQLPKSIRGWSYDINITGVNSNLCLYNPYETIQNPYRCLTYCYDEKDVFHRPLYEKWRIENDVNIWYNEYEPFTFTIACSKRKYNKFLKNGEL